MIDAGILGHVQPEQLGGIDVVEKLRRAGSGSRQRKRVRAGEQFAFVHAAQNE